MKSFLEFLFHPLLDEDAYIEFSIGGVHKNRRRWYAVPATYSLWQSLHELNSIRQLPANSFVGPTLRAKPDIMGKANCKTCSVVWIDWDKETRPVPVLPPSCIVWSGHGYHYYWKLDKWYTDLTMLEDVMIRLEKSMNADACHNIDRIMRLPGTVNAKDKANPVDVKLIEMKGTIYSLHDIDAGTKLGPKVIRKIINGNMQGFNSRSDRDWGIIRILLQAGMSDTAIERIFQYHKCGDKYRDPKTDGPKYLAHTIEKARGSTGAVAVIIDADGLNKSGLREAEDGYYSRTSKGAKRISTFTIEPILLLEGDDEDYILCNVKADGTEHIWKDEVLPISSLINRHAIKRWCTKAAWIWLGRDADVEALQIHLISTLQAMGMPHSYATHVLGMQTIPGETEYYYVANESVMDAHGNIWHAGGEPGPLMYIDRGCETPHIVFKYSDVDVHLLRNLGKLLPQINAPDVIWPLIGWFMATPLKPVFESLGYRFPICNVFGTRGSGKTTTILQVFQPLLGYSNERTYDAKTTRFVTLVLLGSTSSIPIAFSEFRVASVGDFSRYILLAYDTGSDPRGQRDQTTIDYPLRAPFSIDGEDKVEDAASLERIIAVGMVPANIGEDMVAHDAFDAISGLDLQRFTASYIRYAMQSDLEMLLDTAEQALFNTFPTVLPNRIRRNLTIVWAGIQLFSSYMQHHGIFCYPKDGAAVLQSTLHNVFSTKLGRAATEADAFVELVANAAARGVRSFPYTIENDVLWFQLAPAFEYYVSQRSTQRRSTLGRGAIAIQLHELIKDYVVEPMVKVIKQKKVLAYGIDLRRATIAGLDLPRQIVQGEVTIILEDN